MNIHNVLFATSEISPLKPISQITDMTMQLPPAIKTLRRHIYVVVPAYHSLLTALGNNIKLCAEFKINGLEAPVNLLEGKLPGSSVKLLLADIPGFFDSANETDDNTEAANNEHFARFCQVVAAIAQGDAKLTWEPQLVHCNGWQTGLVPALLTHQDHQVATLFTLHNPGEQECVALEQMSGWGLPPSLTDDSSIIMDGQICFTKAALRYADNVSTTSPTYAKEITTASYGCGLEDLLRQRQDHLFGILNGINYQKWNPAKDKRLPRSYNSHTLDDKVLSKLALQRAFNLPPREKSCLIGIIGDLTTTEGTDLMLEVIPELLKQDMQIILLGKGDLEYVSPLRDICLKHSEQIAAHIREDSKLTHLIIGGADIFLAPSRLDPCASRSRLALRYGTVPAVNNGGALADSIIDTNSNTLTNNTASGFLLDLTDANTLLSTLNRAISFYLENPKEWKKIAINGMQQDFSWRRTARQYIDLYKKTIEIRGNSNFQV
jgi:starch synthase